MEKQIASNHYSSKATKLMFVIVMSVSLLSCSQEVPFLTSAVVPSAQGNVTIKNDDNDNYIITLNIERLADPTRLTPPKSFYTVWMETENHGVKNIGQLKTSTGFLSNAMKSSLTTVTPFKPIDIFITGEDSATLSRPGLVVLQTGAFSVK